jgi:hypothetical protein
VAGELDAGGSIYIASQRETANSDEIFHDERRCEPLHARERREVLVIQAAVGVEVGRDDAQ